MNNNEIIKNNQLFLKNQPAIYDKTYSFEVFNSLFSFRVATEKRCKRTHSKLIFFFFKINKINFLNLFKNSENKSDLSNVTTQSMILLHNFKVYLLHLKKSYFF